MAHVKKKNASRHWTQEEIDYALDKYTTVSIAHIAKRLGRTELAVRRKIEKILGTRKRSYSDGFFSTMEIADILSVTKETVNRWIRQHNFPAIKVNKKMAEKKGNKNNHYIYIINPDDVWGWVKDNRDKFNIYARQIQRGMILPEPRWLLEDIENDVWYGRNEEWTKEMLATLYKYRFEDGLKLRECAEKFGKSLPAIQKQLKKINEMKMSELNKLKSLTKTA